VLGSQKNIIWPMIILGNQKQDQADEMWYTKSEITADGKSAQEIEQRIGISKSSFQ